MPLEIALLPIVESAFNPNALSVSRASGIWQFMPATGKSFGLKQNVVVRFAARRDRGNRARALDYLQKLNDEFNDWQLSLAAYNWGEGNVGARSRATAPRDCRRISRASPRWRTRRATTCRSCRRSRTSSRDPQKYGLVMADVPDAPYFTVVRTTARMDVKRGRRAGRDAGRRVPLAQSAAQPARHLGRRRIRDAAADRQGRGLRGEARSRRSAARVVAGVPDEGRARRCRRSRSGTACRSRRCARSTASGRAQTVPTGLCVARADAAADGAKAAESLADAVFTTVPAGRTFFYTVRRGDTLTGDRRRYGVTMQDLKRWNRLARDDVRAGAKLRVTSDVPPVKSAGKGHARAAKAKASTERGSRAVAARPKSGGGGRGGSKTAATTPATRASANGH